MVSTHRRFRIARLGLVLSPLALLVAGSSLGACAPEFKTACPEGKVRVGNGDVDEVCKEVAGAAGAGGDAGSSGSSGSGGSAGAPVQGSGGSGGSGGGAMPPGTECEAKATTCSEAGQQTCGDDGKWGAAVPCDIACDTGGKACVVPTQIGVGQGHACALLSDGTVRCWGDDSKGQLGQGVELPSNKPLAVTGLTEIDKLYVGGNDACAVRKDKTALCWGDNSYEQITPNPNGTSDLVRTPTSLNVQGVETASTNSHVCILKNVGSSLSLQCKGSNSFGKLGNDSENDSANFVAPVGLPSGPSNVSNGSFHTCAALQNGAVYCWGYSSVLGFSSGPNYPKPRQFAASGFRSVTVGNVFSCAIGNDNSVSCWGSNELGELGRGPGVTIAKTSTPGKVSGGTDVKQVAAGSNHACILKNDGSVSCWGYNSHNQLGNTCSQIDCEFSGGLGFSRSPVLVPQLTQVEQIAAGLNTTCALKADKSVMCWGNNDNGQLGNGQLGGSSATPARVVWK